MRNGRKLEPIWGRRIGCNGSQGGVRKKLESKLVNQHPNSRVVLAERKLTSYVYAVGKQPASNL
ncbi:hypothetical protein TIFTF001_029856 [Ficus carica]|uniref:Uncharacterized protein n=1 Tax=Ficus carica TaxID=3494 RepID=A0AA88J3C4_FICCA|nr:hypothetical protein TIFTF001_029856 [Ficus carica]